MLQRQPRGQDGAAGGGPGAIGDGAGDGQADAALHVARHGLVEDLADVGRVVHGGQRCEARRLGPVEAALRDQVLVDQHLGQGRVLAHGEAVAVGHLGAVGRVVHHWRQGGAAGPGDQGAGVASGLVLSTT